MASRDVVANGWLLIEDNGKFKCTRCNFKSPARREVAEMVHRLCSPSCHSSLESDDALMSPRYRSALEHSSEAGLAQRFNSLNLHNRVPQPDDAVSAVGGLNPQSFRSSVLRCDDAGFGRTNPNLHGKTQPSRDPNLLVPKGVVASSATQQTEAILRSLRCSICYVRWCNLVIQYCRHLNCDMCISRYQSWCGLCRGTVSGAFPIRFHSVHMIEGLNIPDPLADQYDMKTLLNMGFERNKIKRVINHVSAFKKTPTTDDIVDLLLREGGSDDHLVESTYSIPTPEQMESVLNDSAADAEVKARLGEWLQVTSKCLICQDRPPCICLIPCYHLAICLKCYNKTEKTLKQCPDSRCGKPIENQVKIHTG